MKYLESHGKFHHLGMAARDFESSVQLMGNLGYALEGRSFVDEAQGVRGQFLTLDGNRIEVLADLVGSSTLIPWLKYGDLIPYHLGYLVSDLNKAIQSLQNLGLRVVREPCPAVAFGGRKIVFLASRSRLLIELIED